MKMKLCLLVVACAFLLAPCFIAESLAVTCYCDENPINVPVSTYWTGGGTPLTSLGANTCYSLYGWVCGKGACSSYPTWNAAYGDMPDMDVTQLCSAISQFGDNPTQCFACTGWTPTTGSTSTGGTGSTSTSGSNITIPKTGTSVSFTKDSVRLVIPKIVSNESSGQSGSLYMRVYAGTYKVAEKLLGQLQGGYVYQNIDVTLPLTAPPNGTYSTLAALEEETSRGTFTLDSIPGPVKEFVVDVISSLFGDDSGGGCFINTVADHK